MFLKGFLEYAEYKCIALGSVDNSQLLNTYDSLTSKKIDIKYIIVEEKTNMPDFPIPVFTWNDMGGASIDLVLVFEDCTDNYFFKLCVDKYGIDLIDINSVSSVSSYINDLHEINKKMAEKNANFISFLLAPTYRLRELSEREKALRLNGNIFTETDNVYMPHKAFDDSSYDDESYILELINASRNWERKFEGASYYNDKFCNVIEGNRFVYDTPEMYDNIIYIFGGCMTRCIIAEDKNTIASHLQKYVNDNSNRTYKVVNIWNTVSAQNTLPWINSLNISSGDYFFTFFPLGNRMFSVKIISYITKFLSEFSNIIFKDLLETLESKERTNGEIFIDDQHWSHKGYKVCAHEIYDVIENTDKKNLTHETTKEQTRTVVYNNYLYHDRQENLKKNKEFRDYLKTLTNLKKKNNYDNVGAVVVNCNPFTKGHRYLLEEASKKVDFLYIFVVEEDRSIFSFSDRLTLVKNGVADLKNVEVIPSGHFIISNYNSPEYSTKDDIKVEVDTSFDITVFAKYIAPNLGIKTRFAGTEPNCQLTRAYNTAMKEILPSYNINYYEFDRIESDGAPISASLVRKLLNDHDFDRIRDIVPDVTYNYLIEKYKLSGDMERTFINAQRQQERGNFTRALGLYMQVFKNCPEQYKKDILICIGNCSYLMEEYCQAVKSYLNSVKLGNDKLEITEMILRLFYNEDTQREIYNNNVELMEEYCFSYTKTFLPFDEIKKIIIYSDKVNTVIYSKESGKIDIITCDEKLLLNDKPTGKVVFMEGIYNLRYLTNLELVSRGVKALPWQKDAFYLYYRDIQSLSTLLSYESVKELLDYSRTVILVGIDDMSNFFSNVYSCFPDTLEASLDTISILKTLGVNTATLLTNSKENIKRYYSKNKDKIVDNIKNGIPKILFITSRFTTAVQYHTRNCYEACLNMGYDARLHMECSDIHLNNYFSWEVDKYRPDIIFMIDWLRFSAIPWIDDVVFVTWIQDPMPDIMRKDAPSNLKDRDFILNLYTTWDKFLQLGYPKNKIIDAPIVANPHIYKHYDLTEEEYEKYSCDITIVCHASYSKGGLANFMNKCGQVTGHNKYKFERSINSFYDKIYNLYRSGKINISNKKNLLSDALKKEGFALDEAMIDDLLMSFLIDVEQCIFREVLAEWIIEAGYTNVKLWGSGWINNERFKDYAMGPAENGETLSKIYNASKITIGNNIAMTATARVFESILSGCFYLSNTIKYDDAGKLENVMVKGKEFDFFESKKDMLKKIEYYLNNDGAREEILKNGQQKIKEQLTFEALMSKMMTKIKHDL